MTNPVDQLDYQPRRKVDKRKRINRILGLFVAVLLAVLAIRLGPLIVLRVRLLYLQNRCLDFNASSGTIAFASDSQPPAYVVPGFNKLEVLLGYYPTQDLVFVHERVSPDGHHRLVAVNVDGKGSIGSDNALYANSWDLIGLTTPIPPDRTDDNSVYLPMGTYKRIYAGQIDSNNPAHFTIAVLVGTRPFTYDGWLRDDGTVALELRDPIPPPSSSPALSR